jgi:hypothetical protein
MTLPGILVALTLAVLMTSCSSPPPKAPAPSPGAGAAQAPGTVAARPAAPELPAVPELAVTRVVEGTIRVDGDLSEWASVAGTGPLVHPGDGRAVPDSPVAGDVKVAWDATGLHVAFSVSDARAESPFSETDVDPHLWEKASAVEIMLQPGDPGDNREYYEIQIDIHGAVWDTRFDDYNRPVTGEGAERQFGHQAWSAKLERKAVVTPGTGYVLEATLPWASLSSTRTAIPPAAGSVWRANFYTFRDGQRQALAWSPLHRQGNFHRASRFGKLKF